MKRILAIATMVVLTLALSAAAFASNGEKTAKPSQTKFLMDGKEVSFDVAYSIDDSNYIQLRSVAQALSGTKSQFNVYWDNELRQAVIETGKPYTGVAPAPEPAAPQSYKIGDTIVLENATLCLTGVKTSKNTPPDEYGSTMGANSGHTLLCVSFDVTTNRLNGNNTLWAPTQFIRYATGATGINYEGPFAQGTAEFGANEKKSVTVYIQIPENETITSIAISDGASGFTTVSMK